MRKYLKQAVLRGARAIGLFRLARYVTGGGVRILAYHGAWLGGPEFRGDAMFMQPETFSKRLEFLRSNNYAIVTLDDAAAALRGEKQLPPASVVITIDDGWYGTFSAMRPTLERYNAPATLYCDTANLEAEAPVPHVTAHYIGLIAGEESLPAPAREARTSAMCLKSDRQSRERAYDEMRAHLPPEAAAIETTGTFHYMSRAELREFFAHPLFDVQLHTHSHSLHQFAPHEIAQEITQNRRVLSQMCGVPPSHFTHFCYPSGVTSDAVADTLDDLGIETATTTENRIACNRDDPQFLPRFLDGDNVSELEFEAELSGLMHLARNAFRPTAKRVPRAKRPAPAKVAIDNAA